MQTQKKDFFSRVAKKIATIRSSKSASAKQDGLRRKASKGRSMIEMLGVLAIIGVLSIGGLMGFQFMLRKHSANNALYEATLMSKAIETTSRSPASFPAGHEFTVGDMGATTYPMVAVREPDTSAYTYYIRMSNVPEKVCSQIVRMMSDSTEVRLIKVGEYSNDGDSSQSTDCAGAANDIYLFYTPDDIISSSDPEEPEINPCDACTPGIQECINDYCCTVVSCPSGSTTDSQGCQVCTRLLSVYSYTCSGIVIY